MVQVPVMSKAGDSADMLRKKRDGNVHMSALMSTGGLRHAHVLVGEVREFALPFGKVSHIETINDATQFTLKESH